MITKVKSMATGLIKYHKLFILLTLTSISLTGYPQEIGNFEIKLNLKGQDYNVAFHVTLNYQKTEKYPLIIALHQGGSNGVEMRNMLNPAVHYFEAILVCPDNADVQSGMLDALIEYCKSNYNIDTNKIIITGYSIGGNTATKYAFDHINKVTGLIGIAPAVIDYEQYNYTVVKNLPVAIITGSADDFIDYIKGFKNNIETNNGKLKYIEKEGVEHMDPYYSSVEFTNDWYDSYEFIIQNNTYGVFNFQVTGFQIINGSFNLKIRIYSLANSVISIVCYDINGREILKPQVFNISAGLQVIEPEAKNLIPGVYIWSLTDKNGHRLNKKVYFSQNEH